LCQLSGVSAAKLPFRADAGARTMDPPGAGRRRCIDKEPDMTTLLTTHDVARIVATHGLPQMFSRLVDYLEADFARWNDFDKTARTAAHSDVGVIELMPVADDREYSFKFVNGHPSNYRHGLSTVMAFGALADVETGMPTVPSELTMTTAIQIGRASCRDRRESPVDN